MFLNFGIIIRKLLSLINDHDMRYLQSNKAVITGTLIVFNKLQLTYFEDKFI